MNSKIENTKTDYIKNLLVITKKGPKKCWRNIKELLGKCDDNVERVIFKDPNTGLCFDEDRVPVFLNEYFANISERVCDSASAKVYNYT